MNVYEEIKTGLEQAIAYEKQSMTDKEIKKALKESFKYQETENLVVFNAETFKALINHSKSLKAENKELTEKLYSMHRHLKTAEEDVLELKAENERLEKEVAKEFTCFVGDPHKVEHCPYLEELEKVRAENERLIAKVNRLKKYDEERDIRLHARLIAEAKAEARKEFAEELIENSEWIPLAAMPDRFITVKRIKELLKEKTGE